LDAEANIVVALRRISSVVAFLGAALAALEFVSTAIRKIFPRRFFAQSGWAK